MLRFSLFVVSSMMVASTSTAGGISPCPVDTLPIQIVNETSSGSATSLSAAKISDSNPHFRAFVTAVTEHVAARLTKEKLCMDRADSKKRSLLQFVNWRIEASLFSVPSLDARPSGGCRISSPWIDLAFERRPVPWIRGVVRWNERQLLADQAVLAGARNVPPGVAMPLKQRELSSLNESEFRDLANDYANSEIPIPHGPVAKPIEERIPPDLLWLFRHSWQTDRFPFAQAAGSAMSAAMEKGAASYTQLVIALINRCFASDGADIHYSNILDAAGLISLEQYKITDSELPVVRRKIK